MKCIDCAYFDFDIIFGIVCNCCTHVKKSIPAKPGHETEQHECEFFIQKSGVSKWDSYTDREKEEILMEFDERYHGDDESFDEIRNEYSFEEVKEMFIENMKNIDKNRK